MAKRIVLLSDGTGNSAGKLFKTNVWRTYQALDLQGGDQIAVYDDGVGTDAFVPLALAGGALGLGLSRNVRELYAFLCRNWEDGDQIFAFGFSRGAFTIRTLAGLIVGQGIVQATTEAELQRKVAEAYRKDREEFRTNWSLARDYMWRCLRRPARAPAPPLGPVPNIAFVGVWDTVDAYGLPIDELQRGIDRWFRALAFPDQDLSPRVDRACHALALDDERRTFHPVLWNERDSLHPERISQVWFAGAHSDVGGGYAQDALAYVSLAWMMQEAQRAGLRFKPGALAEVQATANLHGELHDSRSGLARYYRYAPRELAALCDDDYNKVHIARPKVHQSVLARIEAQSVPYAPLGIPAAYDVVRFDGSIAPMEQLVQSDGSPIYESAEQAVARAGSKTAPGAQARVFDHVLWRRGLYFASLVVSLFLLAFPWIFEKEQGEACAGALCLFSAPIAALGGALPDVIAFWTHAFSLSPLPFLIGVSALVLTLALSARSALRIRDEAETAWAHVMRPGSADPPPYRPGWLHRIRTFRPLVDSWIWFGRSAVPAMFAVLTVVALLLVTNRVLVASSAAFGGFCTASPSVTQIGTHPVQLELDTADPCRATGYSLQQGKRYAIRFNPMEPWRDAAIVVREPARGFTAGEAAPLGVHVATIMYAATPLKRSLGRNWFQPIARVAAEGTDEYDLRSGILTARTSGELFLFVNDAVLGVPGVWSLFYRNNTGRAQVTIRRFEPGSRSRR